MEARLIRAVLVAALLPAALGAGYRTPNFIVQTSDPRLAEQFAKTAEKCRHDLAVAWLGQAMPEWWQPCVVTAQVSPSLGAGAATSFLFDRGEVFGWRMNVQGSAERIQDSVLPHEITHMIFASHFRAPVPRWADEGGATSVEHPSEQAKHKQMLVQFLRTGRGIAFNEMFAMTEYPQDVMPLYAQAHALADYLIQQGGRRKFVAYVAEGMKTQRWGEATRRHYGIDDLGALQTQWVAWVGKGFPRLAPREDRPGNPAEPQQQLAAGSRLPRPEANLIFRIPRSDLAGSVATPASAAREAAQIDHQPIVPAVKAAPTAVPPGAIRTQLTRPQPFEPARQIVLEWNRP